MAALAPAIAGLAPFFTLLEAVLAIVEFVKAVASLNPVQIAAAIDKFVQTTDKLLGIVPQLSIPLLIYGLLGLLVDFLDVLVEYIQELEEHQQQIQTMKNYALSENLPELLESALCLEDNLDTQIAYFNNALGAMGAFLALVKVLGDFIGLSIDVDIETSGSLSEVVDQLEDIRDTLKAIKEAIPLP